MTAIYDEKMFQESLARCWTDVKERFNHPAIKPPYFIDKGTASYCWRTQAIEVAREFVAKAVFKKTRGKTVTPQAIDDVVTPVLEHEVSHHAFFPREVATHLMLLGYADEWFKERADDIFALYIDLAAEGSSFKWHTSDERLLDLRRGMAHEYDGERNNNTAVFQVMLALYAHAFGHEAPKLEKKEELAVKELIGSGAFGYIDVPYEQHVMSLYLFGEAIKKLLPDKPEGIGGFGSEMGDGAIRRALGEILRKHGPQEHARAQRAAQKRGYRPPEQKGHGAGLETPAELSRHDELIATYDSWARSIGVFIANRTYEKDETTFEINGLNEYELGDPFHRIDIFGSRGVICPGITKVRVVEPTIIPSTEQRVPDALIGLDTSGSMDLPETLRAMGVLIANLCGITYHANGANVGGWNFSTRLAFLSPSRDLEAFQALMCSYWGGGTTLNLKRLHEYVQKMHPGLKVESAEEAERMLGPLAREAYDKQLTVRTPEVDTAYRRVDNILITDGDISNAQEVLDHLQSIGTITRNFVFLTQNTHVDAWRALNMPNTQIISAEKPQDLVGLALGHLQETTR